MNDENKKKFSRPTVTIRGNHVTIRLKLDARNVRPRRLKVVKWKNHQLSYAKFKRFTITHRLNDVGFLKESVFAAMPEGEMTSPVGNQQIIVEGMECSTRKSLLERLWVKRKLCASN